MRSDHAAEIEQQLIKVERTWNEAFKERDKSALERLCSEDFIYTGEDGKTQDRRRYIGESTTRIQVSAYKLGDIAAKIYGDTGIVTGEWKGTIIVDGHASEAALRFTDTFVRRDGHWWAVASQSTRIAEDEPAPR